GAGSGGSGVLLGLGAGIPLADAVMLTGEGEVATEVDDLFGERSTPASLLAGLRWGFGNWIGHVGAGPGLSRGLGTPDYRVLCMFGTNSAVAAAPVVTAPAPVTDSDGDGIPDARDACPAAVEDKDGFEDDDGCPDSDNDGDGIPDARDACPTVAEDKDGFEGDDGCPEFDNDGDGILEPHDKCPL